MNLVKHFLFLGLTEEGKKNVQKILDDAADEPHPWQKQKKQEKAEAPGWTRDERGKPIPPPGWTPPGWLSDEENYTVSTTVMKQASTVTQPK